ncbi:uncharacterized protein A4U43_C02F5260 [Asparagus officinalis]|uniref:Peroxidase n=1 Tax=Asparagus officinalis TaxID=4686 RepID=A0A5P1FGV9_ASPOF|nr:uncharacterized protein A4U43_C02F5260 [Asparagus officinalis]
MASLTVDYYTSTCPPAEIMVKNIVYQALRSDSTASAGLLRMHFHDCFVEGCDGSVLIDSTADNTAEKDSPPNQSLHGFEIIDQAKQVIERICPGVVSCADILTMAARDAVAWAGGPSYDVPKGRKDGRRSKIEDTSSLPPPSLNSTKLIELFGQSGFTAQEVVTLAGAHTLGVAQCKFFKNRLRGFDSTNDVDPTLNPNFANMLSSVCSSGDSTNVSLDWTSDSFDNRYFIALQMGGGVLTSDQTLFTSPETKEVVSTYAMSQDKFFFDFSQVIVKLGMLNVKEGDEGEVRLDCRKIN